MLLHFRLSKWLMTCKVDMF